MLTLSDIGTKISQGRIVRANLIKDLVHDERGGCVRNCAWNKPVNMGQLIESLLFKVSLEDYNSEETLLLYAKLVEEIGYYRYTTQLDPNAQQTGTIIILPGGTYTPLLPIEIIIHAGVPNPYVYDYDGSIGDNPQHDVKLINDDGTYTYDNNVSVTQSQDKLTYTINGQDNNGTFAYSYIFTLYPGGGTGGTPTPDPDPETSLPFTLPYTLNS